MQRERPAPSGRLFRTKTAIQKLEVVHTVRGPKGRGRLLLSDLISAHVPAQLSSGQAACLLPERAVSRGCLGPPASRGRHLPSQPHASLSILQAGLRVSGVCMRRAGSGGIVLGRMTHPLELRCLFLPRSRLGACKRPASFVDVGGTGQAPATDTSSDTGQEPKR